MGRRIFQEGSLEQENTLIFDLSSQVASFSLPMVGTFPVLRQYRSGGEMS